MIATDPDIPRPVGIVEELRRLQEQVGWLRHDDMAALARRLNQPLHRVHEVASFYPLYRLKKPPKVDLRICRDMACHTSGAAELIRTLQTEFSDAIASGDLIVDGVSCLGQCDNAIACMYNDHHYFFPVGERDLRDKIQKGLAGEHLHDQPHDDKPLPWKIDVYGGNPNYDAVRRFCKG